MIGSKLSLVRRVMVAMAATSGVMLVTFAVLATFGWQKQQSPGVVAAGIACGVCWVGGIVALSVPLLFRDPQSAINGLLFGMLFRMGLPLLVAFGLIQSRSELLKAGVLGMFVAAYLVGLVVETLFIWWIAESSSDASASGMVKAS